MKICWKSGKSRIRQAGRRVTAKIEHGLNDISLNRKLALLYILCVLFPLVVTDSAMVGIIVNNDRVSRQKEMEDTAGAIRYRLHTVVDNALELAHSLYSNRYVNSFIQAEYESPGAYYDSYQTLLEEALYEISVGKDRGKAVIYTDNPGIVPGGYFNHLENIQNSVWYQEYAGNPAETRLIAYYEETYENDFQKKKVLSLIQRMDYYHKGQEPDLLKLDLDYSSIISDITNARYTSTVYVCSKEKILFSNDGKDGMSMPFRSLGEQERKKAGVHEQMRLQHTVWDIYVMDHSRTAIQVLLDHRLLLGLLFLANVLLPGIFVLGIRRSFSWRLRKLGEAFENEKEGTLVPITGAEGKDEIGSLMRSYNHMAERINELIQTVYKDRLREQEMDIARQKAELLALHSQINPHFLFNALESIRMHSILKKEEETAEMVEKLALMQRQNVEWGNDMVTVEEEAKFVSAYLDLQKYRFGDKLSWQVEIEKNCRFRKIPRLTLVTFVENACVHGMEHKAVTVWIFVRAFLQDNGLCLEIEDTGAGMSREQAEELVNKMNQADIGQLKMRGRVGILNACIRLKMAWQGEILFEIESEKGAGTIVTIHLKQMEA